MQVFIKEEQSTPQNMNTYSLGTLAGRRQYLAITAITIARITLVIEDRTEADICRALVIKTLFVIELQKAYMTGSV